MAIFRPFVFLFLFLFFMPLQAVTLQDVNGHKIPFSALQGKWVLINYWASWCEPCLAEIPELNRFYEENKHKNVVLFAVNYEGLSPATQKKLIREVGIRYPSLNDPAEVLQLGDIRGVPVTFIFNPEGQLARALYGGQSARGLKRFLMAS